MSITRSVSAMIPEYIDKCSSILKELSDDDRKLVIDILNRAKTRRSTNKTPLNSCMTESDKIVLLDIMNRLSDIDTYDSDDYDYNYTF